MIAWNRTRVWNITWRSTKVRRSSSWCSWLQCRCLVPTVCWLFQSLATSDWRCRTVLFHSVPMHSILLFQVTRPIPIPILHSWRTHARRCAYEPCLRQALTPESCRWHLALLRPPERHGMDCKCTQYWYRSKFTLSAVPVVYFAVTIVYQLRFLFVRRSFLVINMFLRFSPRT